MARIRLRAPSVVENSVVCRHHTKSRPHFRHTTPFLVSTQGAGSQFGGLQSQCGFFPFSKMMLQKWLFMGRKAHVGQPLLAERGNLGASGKPRSGRRRKRGHCLENRCGFKRYREYLCKATTPESSMCCRFPSPNNQNFFLPGCAWGDLSIRESKPPGPFYHNPLFPALSPPSSLGFLQTG